MKWAHNYIVAKLYRYTVSLYCPSANVVRLHGLHTVACPAPSHGNGCLRFPLNHSPVKVRDLYRVCDINDQRSSHNDHPALTIIRINDHPVIPVLVSSFCCEPYWNSLGEEGGTTPRSLLTCIYQVVDDARPASRLLRLANTPWKKLQQYTHRMHTYTSLACASRLHAHARHLFSV